MNLRDADCARMKKVLIFGDSIAFGQGVSLHKGWVARLSLEVEKKYQDEVLIVNSSVNGSTTHAALDRIAYEIQNPGADVVVIQFGLNDCNYWMTDRGLPRVSSNSFKANLEEIIERCFHFKVRKIILVTNHPTNLKVDFSHSPVSYAESSRHYNKIIRSVGDKYQNIVLVDMESIFEEKMNPEKFDHLLQDGLHLSSKGHEIYSKYLIPVITNMIDQID